MFNVIFHHVPHSTNLTYNWRFATTLQLAISTMFLFAWRVKTQNIYKKMSRFKTTRSIRLEKGSSGWEVCFICGYSWSVCLEWSVIKESVSLLRCPEKTKEQVLMINPKQMSFIQFESTWRFPVCLPGKRTPTCQSDNILCLYFVTEWIFRTVLHYFQKFPTVLMWCRLKKKVFIITIGDFRQFQGV